MPERLRTIVNGLRRFVGERRRAPRHPERLPVTVAPAEPPHAHDARQGLAGHTCDLSVTGLGLILPAIRLGGRYLMGEGRKISVQLELPTRTIRLRATPMRYERLDAETGGETGYLVGAHISDMADEDRAHFIEYLRSLRKV